MAAEGFGRFQERLQGVLRACRRWLFLGRGAAVSRHGLLVRIVSSSVCTISDVQIRQPYLDLTAIVSHDRLTLPAGVLRTATGLRSPLCRQSNGMSPAHAGASFATNVRSDPICM